MDSKLPAPQACLTVQSATQVYVYSSTTTSGTRYTYNLLGSNWVLSATSTSTAVPTGAYCQPSTVTSFGNTITPVTCLLLVIICIMVLKTLAEWFHLRGQR